MLPIAIDSAQLHGLRLYAETHVIMTQELHDIAVDGKPLPQEFIRYVPVGMHINYTVEDQPGGLLRHFSCAMMDNSVPHRIAVELMLPHLGFSAFRWWTENEENDTIVHIYDKVEDGEPLLRE